MGDALVGFGVRQHARTESISKRARSTTPTSLRLESTTCGRSRTVSRKTLLQIAQFLDAIQIQWFTDVCRFDGPLNCVRPRSVLRSLTAISLQAVAYRSGLNKLPAAPIESSRETIHKRRDKSSNTRTIARIAIYESILSSTKERPRHSTAGITHAVRWVQQWPGLASS